MRIPPMVDALSNRNLGRAQRVSVFDRQDRRIAKGLIGSLELTVLLLRRRHAELELSTEGPFDRSRSLQLDGVLDALESLAKVETVDLPPMAFSRR